MTYIHTLYEKLLKGNLYQILMPKANLRYEDFIMGFAQKGNVSEH